MMWEYLEKQNLAEYELNQYGKEGWELISIFRPSGMGYDTRFYFKRPLKAKP